MSRLEPELSFHQDVTPENLGFMFGAPRNWRMIDPRQLGRGLIDLISTSFVEYLKNG
jgi:hypothetical protein